MNRVIQGLLSLVVAASLIFGDAALVTASAVVLSPEPLLRDRHGEITIAPRESEARQMTVFASSRRYSRRGHWRKRHVAQHASLRAKRQKLYKTKPTVLVVKRPTIPLPRPRPVPATPTLASARSISTDLKLPSNADTQSTIGPLTYSYSSRFDPTDEVYVDHTEPGPPVTPMGTIRRLLGNINIFKQYGEDTVETAGDYVKMGCPNGQPIPALLRTTLANASRYFHSDVMVTSAYRSAAYNAMVYRNMGKRNQGRGSQHIHCRAVDFYVKGINKQVLYAWAKKQPGITGVGLYMKSEPIHIDIRSTKAQVTWCWGCGGNRKVARTRHRKHHRYAYAYPSHTYRVASRHR